MRDATAEEVKGIDEYIKSISVKTGINFFDMIKVGKTPTNGDVLKALFPYEGDFETDFDEKWWNAPYKAPFKSTADKSDAFLIDTWLVNGKTAELWSVKGKLQVRIAGTIHNFDGINGKDITVKVNQ